MEANITLFQPIRVDPAWVPELNSDVTGPYLGLRHQWRHPKGFSLQHGGIL